MTEPKHGCYNRPPLRALRSVQDGWLRDHISHTRSGIMVALPDPMTKDCQYSLLVDHPRCAGCVRSQYPQRSLFDV